VARDASWQELSLVTDRLCLRPPTLHDAEALYDLFADEQVMRGLNKVAVSAVEDVRGIVEGMLEGWRTDGLGAFILQTNGVEQRVIGQAGLMIFDTRGWTPSTWARAGSRAQPELGWALIRAHWGRGYATEAAAAIRDWAREARSISELVSLISPDNHRSQAVARRLGATPAESIAPLHTKRKAVVCRYPAG
jgi:RimJ/RimL family protein N-acetyltransferase